MVFAVFEWGAVGLADYGEELVDGVVCVYGDDFADKSSSLTGVFGMRSLKFTPKRTPQNKIRQGTRFKRFAN